MGIFLHNKNIYYIGTYLHIKTTKKSWEFSHTLIFRNGYRLLSTLKKLVT